MERINLLIQTYVIMKHFKLIWEHELKLSHCSSSDSKLLLCLFELLPSGKLSLICQYEAAIAQNLRP
jgi:hypothetical protein